MSLRHESALVWAGRFPASMDVRLGILEAYAMQRHPAALQLMGDDGRAIARSAASSSRSNAPLLLLIPVILALAAPIVGLAAILGDPAGFHRMDASASVPIAGASFALAAIVQVVAAVLWWRDGRVRHHLVLMLGFGTAIFAAITWAVMQGASALDGFDDWAGWRLPVAVAGVLGLAFGILQIALGRGRPVVETESVDVAAQQELRAVVDALPVEEREAIVHDRNAAIALLIDRARLPAELGDRAMRAELGTLHLLDPELKVQRR